MLSWPSSRWVFQGMVWGQDLQQESCGAFI